MQQQRRRRSRLIFRFLSLGLLAGAALTASPAQAVEAVGPDVEAVGPYVEAVGPDVEAVGPYYALPSWDQKITAANRFVVLTNWFNQAVLDKETGLVWEKSTASDFRAWGPGQHNARLACATRNVGGRKGWRLPSIVELTSLIDPTRTSPALPLGHPFIIQPGAFWSATTSAEDSTQAWFVGFTTGNVGTYYKTKIEPFRVWCVRGGMNADAY